MALVEQNQPSTGGFTTSSKTLADGWRRLGRIATFVALLGAPSVFLWAYIAKDWGFLWSLLFTIGAVAVVRGLIDVILRKFVPWPTLYGDDSEKRREADALDRKRWWFWSRKLRFAIWVVVIITILYGVRLLTATAGEEVTWLNTLTWMLDGLLGVLSNPQALIQVAFVFFLFIANFAILFGPLLGMGMTQIKGFEPGDADWGVKLDDVRGQAEPKEEVRRVVSLWQSGEAFEQAGGKRERGLLFLGAPGTGKTMLAKAIATGFNSPFISIPGSGFASTFIGIDAVLVRYLMWKAKRMARKWGGQCIVFIDEIDAVGMRRASLGTGGIGGATGARPLAFEDVFDVSGDTILESIAWREQRFAERDPGPAIQPNALTRTYNRAVNFMVPGGMGGGGSLALNQILVSMDGLGSPPFGKRFLANRVNNLLDAVYIVPRHIGKVSLRIPKPKPANEQIYFIGACNVPIEVLDPALTRPGRMGRHVWFRTPTKQDRMDVFDLYLGKVSHEPDLDTPKRRDELARITNGYSPAMIEQVCSMALTIAHNENRERFGWTDIVNSLTTVESGTAVGIEYVPEETRAVAIHEAGHAVCAHVYMKSAESTRLSIKMRGGSLGHHQALETEERFSSWRHEEVARLIWTLGAMAAEHVFYGENSRGVAGDVMSATSRAAWMVGMCAMGPAPIELGRTYDTATDEEEARKEVADKFRKIGNTIMNGSRTPDSILNVLSDKHAREEAAELIGQAYLAAYHLVLANKDGVEKVADVLVERREMHGDEVIELLDSIHLTIPEVDLTQETTWPRI